MYMVIPDQARLRLEKIHRLILEYDKCVPIIQDTLDAWGCDSVLSITASYHLPSDRP